MAEVHYLFADPFRPAAGGGDRLRAAGVRVQGPYLDLREDGVVSSDWSTSTGIYSVEAWLFSVLRGRPHVTLKLARTADGFIAASDGSSQWITGPAARARVHAHHLGLDVHDCAKARRELYLDGVLEPGMVFTIEPGLYFQADDLTVPEEYRGIGVRIEDDILVTEDGAENLSAALPRTPDEIEAWMARLQA